ncbi:hypothetical protein; putative non-ribosomal peptide synthetase from Pseudomonas aeruginosa [Frankia alni ACN14a]|uniref:Uncharacterized protein n=1 Tax=Frankia alni (strain DSM 45986 / CECT 9034 / ACN14a) TaxID=326424 RepID=Q0RCD8_FRAAA|nr:hypothetical protein; putative non-ribosomal peptide synthetase from Pseudomonas aeruginosa [Frankia alni ACN14a]
MTLRGRDARPDLRGSPVRPAAPRPREEGHGKPSGLFIALPDAIVTTRPRDAFLGRVTGPTLPHAGEPGSLQWDR